jgi:hypothetical protein
LFNLTRISAMSGTPWPASAHLGKWRLVVRELSGGAPAPTCRADAAEVAVDGPRVGSGFAALLADLRRGHLPGGCHVIDGSLPDLKIGGDLVDGHDNGKVFARLSKGFTIVGIGGLFFDHGHFPCLFLFL